LIFGTGKKVEKYSMLLLEVIEMNGMFSFFNLIKGEENLPLFVLFA